MSPVTLSCDNCGAARWRRPSYVREHNFCNNDCRMQWWREVVQPKMSENAQRVLSELHAEGKDPRITEQAQQSRSKKVAASNRQHPRRAKK